MLDEYVIFGSIVKKLNWNTNIHVYLVELDKCSRHFKQFSPLLSMQEKNKALQYHTNLLNKNYVIRRGILRCILGYYLNKLPQNVIITSNIYGKLELQNHPIAFNLSYTNNLVVYAVTLGGDIGIDVEYIKKELDFIGLSSLVCSPEETPMFLDTKLTNSIKLQKFYNLWTIKESIVKAAGYGLSYPIKTIKTTNNEFKNKVVINSSNGKQNFFYYQLKNLPPQYLGSVAMNKKIDSISYLMMDQEGMFNNLCNVEQIIHSLD